MYHQVKERCVTDYKGKGIVQKPDLKFLVVSVVSSFGEVVSSLHLTPHVLATGKGLSGECEGRMCAAGVYKSVYIGSFWGRCSDECKPFFEYKRELPYLCNR